MITKIMSQKGFLFSVLGLAGLLTVSPPVFSQTGGMERREDRRGGRQEGRGERQEGRSEARDARQEGRLDRQGKDCSWKSNTSPLNGLNTLRAKIVYLSGTLKVSRFDTGSISIIF